MQPFENVPYSVCRYVGAKRIVTVGASPDVIVSLATGLHENLHRRGGLLVCADADARRLTHVERALQTVELADYAHLRRGDARRTLRSFEGRVDLVWLACGSDLADDVLAVLHDSLRPSTCVIRRDSLKSGAGLERALAMTACEVAG